jgi:hypothetical protein
MERVDLAVSLVRSLFWELPRQDKRVALFVAASDETSGGNAVSTFHYSGWIAPEPDWTLYFTPAWQEWVLEGPPKIPYVHMTDMRSRKWREEHGITQDEADLRLDWAAHTLNVMGSLYPFDVTIDAGRFRPVFKEHKLVTKSGATKNLEPDFISFIAYVFAILRHVDYRYPDAEKVDFLVENNSEITKHIYEFYKTMPEALAYSRNSKLIKLLGKFIPGGKDHAPLQAADFLCWHARRADAGTLDERSAQRWQKISHRSGFRYVMDDTMMRNLSSAFTQREKENEKLKGIRELRSHDAPTGKRSTRRDNGKSRRGKTGEKD